MSAVAPVDQEGTDPVRELAGRVSWDFHDLGLLRQAMAHRSWCAEQPGTPSNERLEFLGDAILGFVIADHVYRTYPELGEGQLTDARKAVVNATCLAEVAAELDVGDALLLGKGENAAGGRAKESILSDALEAVIGAVYLDGGPAPAEALVLRLLAGRAADAVAGVRGLDYKTLLQELAARRFNVAVQYDIDEEGPDHAKRFTARVLIDGADRGRGRGGSKKRAEQDAARQAWLELREAVEPEPEPVLAQPSAPLDPAAG